MKKIKISEKELPNFLKGLANVNKSGLTLAKSIKVISSSDLGVLSSEVRKMRREIEWNGSTTDAFKGFERRMKSPTISRTVTLINTSSSASGNFGEALEIAAEDIATTQRVNQERAASMSMYTSVIYIAFFVFLFVVYMLSSIFFPLIPSAGSSPILGGFNVTEYNILFLHAALIEGFCSGLVIGEMNMNLLTGIKHSIIMVVVAYLVFMI
jgi:flagellar protein FlaJ